MKIRIPLDLSFTGSSVGSCNAAALLEFNSRDIFAEMDLISWRKLGGEREKTRSVTEGSYRRAAAVRAMRIDDKNRDGMRAARAISRCSTHCSAAVQRAYHEKRWQPFEPFSRSGCSIVIAHTPDMAAVELKRRECIEHLRHFARTSRVAQFLSFDPRENGRGCHGASPRESINGQICRCLPQRSPSGDHA